MKIKKIGGQILRDCALFRDFIGDFKKYRKYNFGNCANKAQLALEGKIIRQAHILEKGMSLSSPRIGFGQEKIQALFTYLDEYKRLGYSDHSPAFLMAIGTLNAYVSYMKEKKYFNNDLEVKIASYKIEEDTQNDCGIETLTLNFIKEQKQDFYGFFMTRCSVRQFANEDIDISIIKKAVSLAAKAPSACNRQSARVYMFLDKDKNRQIGQLLEGNTGFDEEVNKYLVITGDMMKFTDGYERNQHMVDASLFAMSLVLALHYYGVGSCILQASERKRLDKKRHELLDIPYNEKIVLFIAIGYYKEEFQVAKSKRKPLDEYLVIR